MAASPYGFALVVSRNGTLVGRLPAATLAGDPATPAERVMEAGPTTVRPDRLLSELVDRMRTKNVTVLPVTTPEGRLLGVLPRSVAERTLEGGGQEPPAG